MDLKPHSFKLGPITVITVYLFYSVQIIKLDESLLQVFLCI